MESILKSIYFFFINRNHFHCVFENNIVFIYHNKKQLKCFMLEPKQNSRFAFNTFYDFVTKQMHGESKFKYCNLTFEVKRSFQHSQLDIDFCDFDSYKNYVIKEKSLFQKIGSSFKEFLRYNDQMGFKIRVNNFSIN